MSFSNRTDAYGNPVEDRHVKLDNDSFKIMQDYGELMNISRDEITAEMRRQLEGYKRDVDIDFEITRDYMQCITTSKLPGWIITYAHCVVPDSGA